MASFLCPFKYLWRRVSVLAILSYVTGESFVATAALVKRVGGSVVALPVFILGPLPSVVCFLSFYDSNREGERWPTAPARLLSVGFWEAVEVLRVSRHASLAGSLCKGLPHSVNIGGNINRLTFGKGTQLIIQPCKCFSLRHPALNAVPMGTFSNPAPEPLLPVPSMVPSYTQKGFWAM